MQTVGLIAVLPFLHARAACQSRQVTHMPVCSLMDRALEHLNHELANVRTGRATPGMLDHLKVRPGCACHACCVHVSCI